MGSARALRQLGRAAAAVVEPLERRQLLSGPTWLAAGSLATWDSSTTTLTVTGAATIIADPGPDEPNIIASGSAAQLTIASSDSPADVHVGGITLSSGASLTVASVGATRSNSNHNVLVVGTPGSSTDPTLSIDSSSKLDLQNNDVIVHTGSSDRGSGSTDQLGVVNTDELALVAGLAARGRNVAPGGILNGTWTGSGLTSSTAASADAAAGDEQVILAVAQNSQLVLGSYSNWTVGSASETLASNDVLVKYTFNGDLTLDGAADDNADTVLNGFYDAGASPNNPYALGDLNGDGKVDDSDVTIFNGLYGQGVVSAPTHLAAAQVTGKF